MLGEYQDKDVVAANFSNCAGGAVIFDWYEAFDCDIELIVAYYAVAVVCGAVASTDSGSVPDVSFIVESSEASFVSEVAISVV